MMQNSFDVGLYCRLSRDDKNENLESMSIGNQKQILSDYVTEKGWNLVEVYMDDGFSGTNFDRPDFKRMIEDIESGRINCVITKDLSRLGRNYSMTGYYTDEYFPEQNVRYIAVNDGVDTMGDNNDFAAFHNVINEFYPREISKKVRQVKRVNASNGLFMGSAAPYGYRKSPADKHQLIIDEDIAPIIQRIYGEYINGDNGRRIATRLNQEGILCPRAYHYQLLGRDNPKKNESMLWGSATVLQLISRRVYIGDMVQGQRQVVSFKSKKRRVTDPNEWLIVENTHEPIISHEVWEQAQTVRKKREHIRTPKFDRDLSIFVGMVHCADCGSIMAASLRGRNPKMAYRCGRYSNQGKEACVAHTIREEVLEAIVLNDIHTYAHMATMDKTKLTKAIMSALTADKSQADNVVTRQLTRVERRKSEINSAVKSLYADKMSGKMPEHFFYSLLNDYEKELTGIEQQITCFKAQLAKTQVQTDGVGKWVDRVSDYLKLQKLDRFTAHELIDSIVVSAFYKKDGKKMQDVTINYKFVGNLSGICDAGIKQKVSA